MKLHVITATSPAEVNEQANQFLAENSAYTPITATTTIELANKPKPKAKKSATKAAKKAAKNSAKQEEAAATTEDTYETNYHLVLKENSDGTRGPSEIYFDDVHPCNLADEVAELPSNPASIQILPSAEGLLILATWN